MTRKDRRGQKPHKNRVDLLIEVAAGRAVREVAAKYKVHRNTVYRVVLDYNAGKIIAEDLTPDTALQLSLPKRPVSFAGPSKGCKYFEAVVARLVEQRKLFSLNLADLLTSEIKTLDKAVMGLENANDILRQAHEEQAKAESFVLEMRERVVATNRRLQSLKEGGSDS